MFEPNESTFEATLALAAIAHDPKKFQANINSLKAEREALRTEKAEIAAERAAWVAEKAAQEAELAKRRTELDKLCEFVQERKADAERAHAIIGAEPARLVQMEGRLRSHLMRLLGYDDSPIRSEMSLEQLMHEATGWSDPHYSPEPVRERAEEGGSFCEVEPVEHASPSSLTRSAYSRSMRRVQPDA